MMLKYAPKRIGFQNDAFEARVLLAALDHNSHLFRKPLVGANGRVQYCTQYSKRSKNWQVREVKEAKLYLYWPVLAANILTARLTFRGSVTEHVSIRDDHPKKNFQTIAMKQVPSTAELVKAKLSRFTKKEDTQ